MNIIYVTVVDLATHNGTVDHVLGICKALAKIGHYVRLIAPISNNSEFSNYYNKQNIHYDLMLSKDLSLFKTYRNLSRFTIKLLRDLKKNPDIVYLRNYPMDYYFIVRYLKKMNIPYVCELNFIMLNEYLARKRYLRGYIYNYFQAKTLSESVGWLPVTHEIAKWAENISREKKPWELANNGYEQDELVITKNRKLIRSDLGVSINKAVMIMIGCEQVWHGTDRAVKMLSKIKTDSELWLVGVSESIKNDINKIILKYKLSKRVKIFPWLKKDKLANLTAAADLGIGPLAVDRAKITEGQALKVRTYIALGLPVLLNYSDSKLKNNLPFVRYVSSTNYNILADEVDKYFKSERLEKDKIIQYAKEHLSWESIAYETDNFLKKIINK